LKPCPFCGNDRIGTNANTVKVTIWCERCGARITRGGGKQYASIGNCKRYVEPWAVEAWNRRATDENT
jgi:hypothetical protein